MHLFLLSDLGKGYSYMLISFKMSFLTRIRDSISRLPHEQWSPEYVFELIRTSDWGLLLALIVLVLTLILGAKLRFVVARRWQGFLAVLLLGVWVAQLGFGTRMTLRDLAWVGTLGNVLVLMLGLVVLSSSVRHERPLRALVAGTWALLLVGNLWVARVLPDQLNASRHLYGFNQSAGFWPGFSGGNQDEYLKIMRAHYELGRKESRYWPLFGEADDQSLMAVGGRQALRHKELRKVVRFVFPNQRITLREIGVVSEGFPVWVNDHGYRITGLPEHLREAILVDNSALPVLSGVLLDEQVIRRKKPIGELRVDDLRAIRGASADPVLGVLARRDLQIFVFVSQEDWLRVSGGVAWGSAPRIDVSEGSRQLELRGVEIRQYRELEIEDLERRFFSVIR